MHHDTDEQTMFSWHKAFFVLVGLFGAATLYVLSSTNYLLYHSLIELFAVGVAVSLFTIGWNTRHIVSNNTLFLLAVAYGCVAGLDLLHTLAYSGMGVFPDRGSNLPTQLWIATRFVEASSLFAAALVLGSQRRLPPRGTLTGYGLLIGVLLWAVFSGRFPVMYIQGQGLTSTKIGGEYLICAILGAAAWLFWWQRESLSRRSLNFLLAAIGATLASELSFTLYTDVYGFFNFLGHLLKLFSFFFIYLALVSDLLLRPYVGLFRDLARSRDALRQSENYYRAIFETSGTAMLIIEEDTTIWQVNSKFEILSGYSSQEIEGKKTWIEFVHPDDVERIKENHYLRHQDPDAAPRQYEFRFITRHEEERNVLLAVDMIPGTSRSIASCIDITERKQMEQKLREVGFHDTLTGLYNRNFFEEEMKRLSDGRNNPLGIIVCDLDGLKFVNDTLGHEAGDQMLVNIAEILRGNFRSSDIISRIGGDEFAVLLTETEPEVVELMLQRLRQSVQDYNNSEPEIPLSLSVGHALGEGETADMQALFSEADNRMYREKIQREGSVRSAILQALTVSMEARDFKTEGHCDRFLEFCVSLARALDLSQDFENDLSLLARFHDLGKVGIPDHILFKSDPLTEQEWRQMSQHCEIGHRIASAVPDLEPIADLILKHHERWDGRGYPLGVSGRDIPLACRILAIADAYDVMTSDQPYRRAMTRKEAIDELRRCAGTQFDPELVEKFIKIIEEA